MNTHEPTMTGTKKCTKCERELPVICFPVDKKSKDGLQNSCRECKTKKRPISDRKLRSLKEHYSFQQDD